jgi:hypothetical protein
MSIASFHRQVVGQPLWYCFVRKQLLAMKKWRNGGLYKNGLRVRFLQSHMFLPLAYALHLLRPNTLSMPKSCVPPLYTLDEWPPSHMLLSPADFWMNGPPSHMIVPHTLDEWPPSHILLPPTLFGWMAHQVTCFSSTLWMNGPPSHILLPHTLDECVSSATIWHIVQLTWDFALEEYTTIKHSSQRCPKNNTNKYREGRKKVLSG